MKMNSKPIMIYLELTNEKDIAPVSLECISAGRKIINESGGTLVGLVVGSEIEDAVKRIADYELDQLYTVDTESLQKSTGELITEVVVQVCTAVKPSMLMMGNTANAEDLAPRIAVALDTGVVTDCVEVKYDAGELLFVKPVYSCNVMAQFSILTEPRIITIRSKAYENPVSLTEQKCKIIPFPVDVNRYESKVELIDRIVEEDNEGPKLSVAD
ncbi:MAG: hypothetical protein WCP36_11040, partial [Methanomicrobiales archaeon]